MKMTKSDYRCIVLLYIGVLLLAGIPAWRMYTSLVIDETGTLANAALLSGRSWHTGMLSSGGYYYRYGMGFIWFLPFLLFRDSVLVYRVCGLIDAALFALIPVLVYQICRRDLRMESRPRAVVLALAACCQGDILFFALNRRGDVMLTIVNWICLYVMLRLVDQEDEKGKILRSVLLSFFSVFAYASHSRGIVTVIAVALTIAVLRLVYKKFYVNFPVWAGSLLGFLAVDKFLQVWFRREIWGSGAGHATGLSMESIKLLFTGTGIKSLVKLSAAWLYNAFASTGGLCCVGVVAALMILVLLLRRSGKLQVSEGVIGLFGGLSFAGSAALGVLFFLEPVSKVFTGVSDGRADRIVYGRYINCALGFLVFLGVYVLICRKDLFGRRAKAASVCGYGVTLLFFVWKVAGWMKLEAIERNIGVITSFKNYLKQHMEQPENVLGLALLLFGALMFLVLFLFLFLGYSRHAVWIGIVSTGMGIVLYLYNAQTLIQKPQEKNYVRVETVYETMESFGDIYEEYPVVWVSKNARTKIKTYQALLMEYNLMDYKFEESGGEAETFYLNGELTRYDGQNFAELDNMLVIAGSLPAPEELAEGDYYMLADAEYEEYKKQKQDVLYIKGNELRDELEQRGIQTVPLAG